MKNTILNSTLALSTAFLITILLHEIAHYALAIGLGHEAILYHNRVDGTIGNIEHQLLILAAGPLFSLFQGVLVLQCAKKMRPTAVSLLVLWFGIAGLITFFGYMMIAPISAIGDTGKIFHILNISIIVPAVLAILSLIVLTLILMKSAGFFEKYTVDCFGPNKTDRKKWAISLILVPLLVSIVVITVLQFPIPHVVSILATVCAPFSIMAIFGTFMGTNKKLRGKVSSSSINEKKSTLLLSIFVLAVLVNRILVYGI